MSLILSTFFGIVEAITALLLCDTFMHRRIQKYGIVIPFLLKAIIEALILNTGYFPTATIHKAIIGMLFWFAAIKVTFTGSIWQAIFFSGNIYALINIADYCVLLVVAGITQNTIESLLMGFSTFLFCGITAKIVLFTMIYALSRAYRVKNRVLDLSSAYWLCVLLVPIFTIVSLSITTQYSISQEPNMSVLWNCLGLLSIHMVLVYQLDKVNMERWERAQLHILQKEIALRMENATQLMDAYETQRKESHDFTNHLAVIRELVASNQQNSAQKYIDEILGSKKQYVIVDSGDPVINAVLNEKYSKAKSKDVYIRFKTNRLTTIHMERKDLVTILGNLLDNAIEACQKVSGERIIVLKFLTYSTGKAILSVRNTSNPVEITEGIIRTTKEDALLHGYGLSNIKYVLDLYGYPHTYSWSNGWFTFVTELSCDPEEKSYEYECP